MIDGCSPGDLPLRLAVLSDEVDAAARVRKIDALFQRKIRRQYLFYALVHRFDDHPDGLPVRGRKGRPLAQWLAMTSVSLQVPVGEKKNINAF